PPFYNQKRINNMSDNIGIVNLEETSKTTLPIASGYTNGCGSTTPLDSVITTLGMQSYRIGTGNYTMEGVLKTDFINRLSSLNIPSIRSTTAVWGHGKKRSGKPNVYYTVAHLHKHKNVIEESINEVLQHYENGDDLGIEIWNEPDRWLAPTTVWKVNNVQ